MNGGGGGDGAEADGLPVQQQRGGGRGGRRGGAGCGQAGRRGRSGATVPRRRGSAPEASVSSRGRGGRCASGGARPRSAGSSSESSEGAGASRKASKDACAVLYAEVKSKLQEKLYTLSPRAGFSGVWDSFFIVLDDLGNETGVASCRNCQQLYKFGGSNGTSGMSKHMPKCTPDTRLAPPPAAKERVKQAVTKWVAETMKAHEVVENPAFVELIQTAVDIGKSHGAVDATELLPSTTTVSRTLRTTAADVLEKKLPQIRNAILEGGAGVCTDLWTEKYSRRHYLALTVSYAETLSDPERWSIDTVFLFIVEFEEDESANNIKAKIVAKFNELGISSAILKNVTFISDNGSNVKKALEDWARNYCLGHALNIVLRNGLELKYHEVIGTVLSSCPEIMQVVEKCDEASRHIKGMGKKQLDKRFHRLKTVLQLSNRQCKSFSTMLLSVRSCFQEVQECLTSLDMGRIESSVEELDAIIAFLAPLDFKASREKSPFVTIGKWPQLVQHCTETDEDTDKIKKLRTCLQNELHILNIVLLVEKCKKLVTHLKSSGLDVSINGHLAQEFEVRWNTHVDLLTSIDNNWFEINEVLTAAGPDHAEKLDGITRDRLQLLIKFWLPFKSETKKLEGEDYPTMPLACLAIHHLRKHCQKPLRVPMFSEDYEEEEFEEEAEDFRRLRLNTARLLETVPDLNTSHQIALFLHPKYRELKILSVEEQEKVFSAVRELVSVQGESEPEPEAGPSSPKRSRLEADYKEHDEEWASTGRQSPSREDEVSLYLRAVTSIPTVETLLEWWRTKGNAFPRLQQIAKRLLAIPASSAVVERLFSNAGFIVNVRRTNLKSKTLEAHVFLHKFFLRERKRKHEGQD